MMREWWEGKGVVVGCLRSCCVCNEFRVAGNVMVILFIIISVIVLACFSCVVVFSHVKSTSVSILCYSNVISLFFYAKSNLLNITPRYSNILHNWNII